MTKTFIILILTLMGNISIGQNKADAEKLVNEGVAFHDKGDFENAINRYDLALGLDKDNLLALAEKAYSLFSLQKYDESITCCKKAIEIHPGDQLLKSVYVTYGSACDALKKNDESIAIYNEGIKLFPDSYQLYFNKGITLSGVKKYDEAVLCFQKAVMLNPKHASSHNAIARMSIVKDKRIPAILAFSRFLSLEPQSNRSPEVLSSLQKLMTANVESTGKKSVSISISSDLLGDTTATGKPNENSFSTTDMILSMEAALDFDKKYKKDTEVELFIRKFDTLCASLSESKNDNYGFYWEYYAPYFIEMKEKNLVETFAYIAFASSDEASTSTWIKSHDKEIDQYFLWSKSFSWKSK